MKDFVSNDPNNVSIGDMLEFAAEHMHEKVDGGDSESKGKTTAGAELGLLFAGFQVGGENKSFPVLKTYDELYNMMFANGIADSIDEPDGIFASGDFAKIVDYNKYWSGKFNLLSNNNVPENESDRIKGSVENIDSSLNDNDSIRSITQKAPVWFSGNGQNEKGQSTGEDKVGPFDLHFDETAQMWRATREFPVAGRVLETYEDPDLGTRSNNPYKIEIFGVLTDTGVSKDVVSSGVSKLVSSKRELLPEVYNLSEKINNEIPELSFGDIVNVDIDQTNGTYICTKPDSNSVLLKNDTADKENIPAHSFVEVTELVNDPILGKYYKVDKPSKNSSSVCFITERTITWDNDVDEGNYAIINENYPKLIKYTGIPPVVGDDIGTKEGSFSGERGKTGFIAMSAGSGGVCSVRFFSQSTDANHNIYLAALLDSSDITMTSYHTFTTSKIRLLKNEVVFPQNYITWRSRATPAGYQKYDYLKIERVVLEWKYNLKDFIYEGISQTNYRCSVGMNFVFDGGESIASSNYSEGFAESTDTTSQFIRFYMKQNNADLGYNDKIVSLRFGPSQSSNSGEHVIKLMPNVGTEFEINHYFGYEKKEITDFSQ